MVREKGPHRSLNPANPPALKRLGQNFLSDTRILSRIVDALELQQHETVVEIGAGRGALTAVLAQRAGRVKAIEIDRMLVPLLKQQFAAATNVEIVEGDALALRFADFLGVGSAFKLVGNVPYYITTPLLFRALQPPRPELAAFLVQKEVAERAGAAPGSRVYGALSVNLQAFSSVEMVFTVAAAAFTPRPSVDSALLRLRPRESALVAPGDEESFRELVQSSFAMRRKQLRRILRSTRALSAEDSEAVIEIAGLDPESRPETLSPADFARLLTALAKLNSVV